VLRLRLVVPEIKRHVFHRVAAVSCLSQQLVEEIAEVALVLRRGRVQLAGELGELETGVVADAEELDQFVALRVGEVGELAGGEGEDDFFGGRVLFAEVGCVAEAERLGGCGGAEGLYVVCEEGWCQCLFCFVLFRFVLGGEEKRNSADIL